MFLSNKYTLCYYKIIERALSRVKDVLVYYERHHIIPKSLGGTNNKSNLVYLSAKEHFICHLLLTKMTSGKDKRSMNYAAYRMCHKDNEYIPGSRIYSILKNGMISSNKERPGPNRNKIMSQEQKDKISSSGKGILRGPMSETHKNNLRQKRTQETCGLISSKRKGISTGKRSDETKQKMSFWQKGIPKPKILCEHCKGEYSLLNHKRWHGNNCKLLPTLR